MAGRPGRSGRRRQDHSSPLVDLDRVFADDRFIDSIASSPWGVADRTTLAANSTGRSDSSGARGDLAAADPLADLFTTWRDELASEPMPTTPSLRSTLPAQAPVKPRARRSLRPALSIAAAIAALLVGTATIGSKDAQPGSALWTVTQVVWPNRVESVESKGKVVDAINEAEHYLDTGRSKDAQRALIKATEALGKVDEVDLGNIRQQLNHMWDRSTSENQPTSVIPDPSSVGTPSSSAGTTPPSAAAPTVLAPPPVTVAPTSDTPPAELAGGAVVAPEQAPAPAAAAVAPVIPSSSVVDPSTPASASSDPGSASPVPTTASVEPPASETTSLPPPVPVDPTTDPSPPTSVQQSAPENSPPVPPPAQSPATDPSPTVSTSSAGLLGSVDTAAVTTP